MKILLVNKFLHPNGGAETYLFQLGDALEKLGQQVQYFGMDHGKRIAGNRANAYTRRMDFHSGRKLGYALKTIYSSEARRKIRLVLEDFQPDVCHLNNFNYQLTPSILLEIRKWSRQTNHPCKIVYTAHDYQLVCPNHMCRNGEGNCEKCFGGSFWHCVKNRCIHGSFGKSLIGALEGYIWRKTGVYRQIDTILCCSHFMKTKLDAHPHLAGKTLVMHNFVAQIPREEPHNGEYVLYFGRYSQEKGIRTLVQAAKALPHIPFVFAGAGELETLLTDAANIRNVGFQSAEALRTWIHNAKFSVCASEWYENCPLSVMESLALGTPVLGADIGGIPELIRTGENGVLFESGNGNDLREKIEAMWRSAPNAIRCDFDTAVQYAEKVLKIYQQEREQCPRN